MSQTLVVRPGELRFCPRCLDIYGTVGESSKRCQCDVSADVALRDEGGDFVLPFEICWYCGVEVIASGSRWSAYYCDACRPDVSGLNEALDRVAMVSLPIGRHSLMHAHMRYARPFTTSPLVVRWARIRLWTRWRSFPGPGDDWVDFATHSRCFVPADRRDLATLAEELQSTAIDWFFEKLQEHNFGRKPLAESD
jgi:hypothetical protein